MKLFPAYKKQFSPIRRQRLRIRILLIFFLFLPVFFASAETAQELQNKINQKDSDIIKLEKEIAAYQAELNSLGQKKSSLSGAIKELDLTKKKLNTDIAITQTKIDRTNLKIKSLSDDIGNKEDSITNNRDSIALGIRTTNEFEENTILETILSEDDFTVAWNDIDNMITIREQIREKILELKQIKVKLEDTRKVTIDAKNELTMLRFKLSDQKKIVEQNVKEKNQLLAQTKNNEANYQSLLRDRIAKRDAFEKELRDYEAQLQYILDPSKLPQSGVLGWPLKDIFVTQLFGKTSASGRLYASGTHNGVDFRTSVGTPVLAMAEGRVLGVGNTDLTCAGASFGKFVFLEYNNGLSSTFGHLSLIKVSEGQKVKRGQVVAYSGATGHVTGPHLHVSLYASEAVKMASKPSVACDGRIYRLPVAPINAYLDAMYYLPPYKVN